MGKRIIEISSANRYVKYQYQQLKIMQDSVELGSIPIEDMAALVIDHPQTRISQVLLAELLNNNVMVIISDSKHQPVGMMLPLQHHTTQAERFDQQIILKQSTKKRLWKQIVQNKIRQQSNVLKSVNHHDNGLALLIPKVKSGDPTNIEAQAARRYWQKLFSKDFRRDRFNDDHNRFLNYGYAILRALTARNICASGLHPSFGLHHHNRYNAYRLADDVMEPFRPFVDIHVYELLSEYDSDTELNTAIRKSLLQVIQYKIKVEGELLTLQSALQKSTQSLARIISGANEILVLPD